MVDASVNKNYPVRDTSSSPNLQLVYLPSYVTNPEFISDYRTWKKDRLNAEDYHNSSYESLPVTELREIDDIQWYCCRFAPATFAFAVYHASWWAWTH